MSIIWDNKDIKSAYKLSFDQHYGAKWAQIVKWSSIFGVHDQTFMKFGHQTACRNIKYLKNSNDIHTTSNDIEMTFNTVFSTCLNFWTRNVDQNTTNKSLSDIS